MNQKNGNKEKNDSKNNTEYITVKQLISTVTKLSSYEYANNGSILTALKLILSWHKKTTEDMCSDIFEISEDIYQKN